MGKLIDADAAWKSIIAERTGNGWSSDGLRRAFDSLPDMSMLNTATLDRFVQAAYKAGQEGKPLMVALNEVEK